MLFAHEKGGQINPRTSQESTWKEESEVKAGVPTHLQRWLELGKMPDQQLWVPASINYNGGECCLFVAGPYSTQHLLGLSLHTCEVLCFMSIRSGAFLAPEQSRNVDLERCSDLTGRCSPCMMISYLAVAQKTGTKMEPW